MRETSIEVSGKTEDDAIAKALAEIGLDRDEVSVEIVRRAKAGLLGLGGTSAVVKVTYMTDEPESAVAAVESPPPAKKSSPAKQKATPTVSKKTPMTKPAEDSPADRAEQFLVGLLDKMGIVATPEVREEDGTLHIELLGSNMGAVIGRRGETLDAIQQLTSYTVNRGVDKRTRIYVDAENYRKKREETLIRLAQKTADKVMRYRKNMGLEPMNAYERHVIHTALQDTPNVTTYSSGTEPHRRVFVAYDRAKQGVVPESADPINVSEDTAPASKAYREWA